RRKRPHPPHRCQMRAGHDYRKVPPHAPPWPHLRRRTPPSRYGAEIELQSGELNLPLSSFFLKEWEKRRLTSSNLHGRCSYPQNGTFVHILIHINSQRRQAVGLEYTKGTKNAPIAFCLLAIDALYR